MAANLMATVADAFPLRSLRALRTKTTVGVVGGLLLLLSPPLLLPPLPLPLPLPLLSLPLPLPLPRGAL
jgi:hypothetical protein